VDILQGNYTKAKQILNWQPKTTFKELVKIMLEADLKEAGLGAQMLNSKN
jgi:GDPmannose 4,6-dehydratase